MLVVDIGSEFVRVADIRRGRAGQWHLHDWSQQDCHDALSGARSGKRKSRRSRRSGRASHVITSVSACDVMVREVSIADASTHVQIMAALEADNPFAQPLSELCVDYRPLAPQADATSLQLLIVATPRKLVEQRIHQLEQLGFRPALIAVDAFALYQLVSADDAHASLLFILLDHQQFSLYVMQSGRPVYCRRHSSGETDVTSLANDISRAVQLYAMSSVMAGAARLMLLGYHDAVASLAQLVTKATGLTAEVLAADSLAIRTRRGRQKGVCPLQIAPQALTLAFALANSVTRKAPLESPRAGRSLR